MVKLKYGIIENRNMVKLKYGIIENQNMVKLKNGKKGSILNLQHFFSQSDSVAIPFPKMIFC